MKATLPIKLIVSIGALGLLAGHLALPSARLDAIALGLVAIAVLPWVSSLIESAEFPGGWKVKFREVEAEQNRQRDEIDVLKFLIKHFLTDDELVHLDKLAAGAPFPFRPSQFFEAELRHLRSLRLIESLPARGIRSLFAARDDVKNHFQITERGREYLRLRKGDQPAADSC